MTSLGFLTDIALLERAGSTVEERSDHSVVRTPANPTFYWGNFLLLDALPDPGQVPLWLTRFEAAFPEAQHRSFGFDVARATVGDVSAFVEQGLEADLSIVLTATEIRPPAHPDGEAVCRAFELDSDWEQSVDLHLACYPMDGSPTHREFVVRRTASNRALVEGGGGSWFGAFVDGALVAQLGLVAAPAGLARFQSVETHPDHRRRGLAGTLAHRAGRYGLDDLGAQTLVMVADPDYVAIRIYRALGFRDSESQLKVGRATGAGTG